MYRSDSGYPLATVNASAQTSYQYLDDNVDNRVAVSYKVSAVNRDGEGSKSNSSNTAVASAIADAPVGLSTSSHNLQINLAWNLLYVAPNSGATDEGSAVVAYHIYRDGNFLAQVGSLVNAYVDADIQWVIRSIRGLVYAVYQSSDNIAFSIVGYTAASTPNMTVPGLTNGSMYYFKVAAINAIAVSCNQWDKGLNQLLYHVNHPLHQLFHNPLLSIHIPVELKSVGSNQTMIHLESHQQVWLTHIVCKLKT